MRKRILLIEDNDDDIELTLHALADARIGNPVDVVRDGQQAIEFFDALKESAPDGAGFPALILLDLKLPKVDGLSVLRHIRSSSSTELIPVVVLTTSSEESDIVKSYQLGANSYIRKPVEFEAFAKAVSHLGLYWLLLNEMPK